MFAFNCEFWYGMIILYLPRSVIFFSHFYHNFAYPSANIHLLFSISTHLLSVEGQHQLIRFFSSYTYVYQSITRACQSIDGLSPYLHQVIVPAIFRSCICVCISRPSCLILGIIEPAARKHLSYQLEEHRSSLLRKLCTKSSFHFPTSNFFASTSHLSLLTPSNRWLRT